MDQNQVLELVEFYEDMIEKQDEIEKCSSPIGDGNIF